MAVALDANGTATTGAVSPVASSTSITVGASASCLFISVIADDSTISVTAPTWNGVSSTLIGTVNTTDTACVVKLYGLVSPASGAKTLSVSWTGGAPGAVTLHAASFTGSISSSVASCFTGFASQANNVASTAQNITVTSSSGDISVAASNANNVTLSSLTATSSTAMYNNGSFGASRAPGSASVAWTGTCSSAVTNCIAGCDIAQSAASTNPTKQKDWPNPTPVTWYQTWQWNINLPTRNLAKPLNQYDWPNPKDYQRLSDYSWIELGLSIIPTPNILTQTLRTQVTSPNPQPITWYQNWIAFGNSLLPRPTPFIPFDYPIPSPITWYRSLEQSSIRTPVQNPFVQIDWPNPQNVTWDRFWSQSPRQPTVSAPFFQLDWPTPKTYQPIDQFWVNNLRLLPKPTPFFQNVDFPLPVVNQPIDPTWISNPSEFLQSNTFPFVQSNYPNPVPVYWYVDYNQNLVIYLPVGIKPFQQSDWPLLGTPIPIDQYWYQSLVLNLPEPPPPPLQIFSGHQWTEEDVIEHTKDWFPKPNDYETYSEIGRKYGLIGGPARAKSLSASQRIAIALQGASARWKK